MAATSKPACKSQSSDSVHNGCFASIEHKCLLPLILVANLLFGGEKHGGFDYS